MKVLWFSPTSALYRTRTNGHNGGGWISALELQLRGFKDIKLGVVFEFGSSVPNETIEGVEYFPLHYKPSFAERFKRDQRDQRLIEKALEIINDFKPDVIQIFGSESWYGQLVNYTQIPIVVHLQGSLPSYYNARYPVGISAWSKIFSRKTSWRQKLMAFRIDDTFHRNALREEKTLKSNRYFMGRTHWDRAIVEFYNPEAKYFHCEEMIRESFMSGDGWRYGSSEKVKIVSTISGPLYKGVDLILKSAELLKRHAAIDFEWSVCGVASSDFIEEQYGIAAKDVNVRYLGVIEEGELRERLLSSTFYVHPSYIDNSPNSVCEAQLLGVPIISTNVGGIASLIEDGVTGLLVPANDPLMLAHTILKNYMSSDLLSEMSDRSRTLARSRHNQGLIVESVIRVYNEIKMII